MIALLVNYFAADLAWFPHVIGIFNNESEIPDEYKRTSWNEDELQWGTPKVKRFHNLKETKKLHQNPEVLHGHSSFFPFYSIEEVKIDEIFDWEK